MREVVEQLKFFSDLGVTHLNVGTDDSPQSLEEIRQEIGDCRRCKLWEGRNSIVFGVGNPEADLMFVGEAPGADEDAQGIPFVGRAGQLLTRIIEAMGLTREQVYIANILKCRPPGNRNPEPDEVETCEGFLFQQIKVVQPRIIVAFQDPGRILSISKQSPDSHLSSFLSASQSLVQAPGVGGYEDRYGALEGNRIREKTGDRRPQPADRLKLKVPNPKLDPGT